MAEDIFIIVEFLCSNHSQYCIIENASPNFIHRIKNHLFCFDFIVVQKVFKVTKSVGAWCTHLAILWAKKIFAKSLFCSESLSVVKFKQASYDFLDLATESVMLPDRLLEIELCLLEVVENLTVIR